MMPIPWPLIFAALVFAAGAGVGWKLTSDHRDALDLAEALGKAAALEATAREIAKIDVKNTTIKQTLETQIVKVPVYTNPDCRNTPEVMGTINEALKGGK